MSPFCSLVDYSDSGALMASQVFHFRLNDADQDEARALDILGKLLDAGNDMRQIMTVAILGLEGQEVSGQAAMLEAAQAIQVAAERLLQMAANGQMMQQPAPARAEPEIDPVIANFAKRVKRHTPKG